MIFCKYTLQSQNIFDEKVTTASNIRLSISNAGTFGNAFRGYRDGSGRASCEFPAGSGIEHLFEGGFWIGGYIEGNQIAVSTSAYDASSGYSTGRGGFEFTNKDGQALKIKSTLADNPNYSPTAVSHQDYYTTLSDKNLIVPGTNIPIQLHTQPLNVDVKFESYNWNYAFSNFFVILNYEITNNSNSKIDSVYFGLWANNVVRNVNITAAGNGGSAFYNKGGNGYLDTQIMGYRFDAQGDIGFTESYIAEKFLGAEDKFGFQHPKINQKFKAHYNTWEFNNTSNPIFFLPNSDQARYIKLTKGLNDDECWTKNGSQNPNCGSQSLSQQINLAGNRADLLSVGPFKDFKPGDKIKVSYAIVLAKKNEDGRPNSENTYFHRKLLLSNAEWAQTAFNGEDKNFNGKLEIDEDANKDGKLSRFILPTPPDIPKTMVVASDHTIDVYWTNNSERSVDPISNLKDFEGYRIYLSSPGFEINNISDLQKNMIKIAEFDKSGNQKFNETSFRKITLDKPLIISQENGKTDTFVYKYQIENIPNGWQYALSVSSFDLGNEQSNLESLESSVLSNIFRVFPGKTINLDLKKNEPFVYPDPYYVGSSWESKGNFQDQNRKLYFANLPAQCNIKIFTAAGDFIDEIKHNQDYNGSDIRWYQTYASENTDENIFTGGEHAWDLLSNNSQILARGIYFYTVQDLENNKTFKGKFLIIK